MNRKTAWMLAIWLPLAVVAAAEVPADLRQRILAALEEEIGAADRPAAEVVVSGDLAAVRLPPGAAGPGSGVYLLERDPVDAGRWQPVTRLAAAAEEHFGDAVILGADTVLVAAPDTAGAGLGPGMAYVFQRHVGGSDRWGLVARLAPVPYPPPGAVEVRQLASPAPDRPRGAGEMRELAPAPAVAAAFSPSEPPPAGAAEPPATNSPEGGGSETAAEPAARAVGVEQEAEEPPEVAAGRRFVVVANMSEKPRALDLAAGLRAAGYPSEIYRNHRGFYVVTLAHLPVDQARKLRAEAIEAGDIPADSYLIVGSSLGHRISP